MKLRSQRRVLSLRDDPNARITIVGHTDSTGSGVLNDRLSVDRAQSVRDYLVGRGVGVLPAKDLDPYRRAAAEMRQRRGFLGDLLLLAIAGALAEQQELFIQSDVLEVIEPMVLLIEASGYFQRPPQDGRPWRHDNPLAVATERERLVLQQGLPVYRVLYERNCQPLGAWPCR